jgi:hypothetical protein
MRTEIVQERRCAMAEPEHEAPGMPDGDMESAPAQEPEEPAGADQEDAGESEDEKVEEGA